MPKVKEVVAEAVAEETSPTIGAEKAAEEEMPASADEDVDFYGQKHTKAKAPEEEPFGVWDASTAVDKGFKVLLYGPTGAGKTWFAATFPRPLFLDLEGGLRTTTQVGPVLRFPKDPKQVVESMQQVRDFYRQVRRAKNPNFDTVIIDSLNELVVLVTKEVVGTFDANRSYEDKLTWDDYGKIGRDTLNTVREFLRLPYHIVFTAVETPREYDGQQVYPKFLGKMIWPEVQRMMEQIGYVHVVKGQDGIEHVVGFRLDPAYIAKDRLGIKEKYLPNHFSSLVRYLPTEGE